MGRIKNVKNRKEITNTHILGLIQECKVKVKDLRFSLPTNTKFLECKATRRAGLACQPTTTTPPTIVLSTFLYKEEDDAIKTIIYHEMGHILAGRGAKHGPIWQKIVGKISNATGLKITRCYSETDLPVHAKEAVEKSLYNFRCKSCGSQLHYSRKTEFVRTYNETLTTGGPRWTCARCQGTFELIK